jgi:arginyl-tRNA synthetase
MLFDPKESLSFTGNTGPYLQYMGARISSMLRKKEERGESKEESTKNNENFSLLASDSEWEVIKCLAYYPAVISEAAANLDPSALASYLYELSKAFSRFYHECPILNAEDSALSNARLNLSRAVLKILEDALYLICVPFLEIM